MNQKVRDTAEKLFRTKFEDLTKREKHVAHHITERTPVPRKTDRREDVQSTKQASDVFSKWSL